MSTVTRVGRKLPARYCPADGSVGLCVEIWLNGSVGDVVGLVGLVGYVPKQPPSTQTLVPKVEDQESCPLCRDWSGA